MSEQTTTTKRVRTTSYATKPAGSKRITKSKEYTEAEVAALCDVTIYAVKRWVSLGYVKSVRTPIEGTRRHTVTITGEALSEFFTARKEHMKGVAKRKAEREAKAAERAQAKAAEAAERDAA